MNNTFLTGRPKHQGRCGGCYAFAGNSVVNYPINRYYLPYNTTEKIRQAS